VTDPAQPNAQTSGPAASDSEPSVTVSLIAFDGSNLPDSLVQGLRNEVIEVAVLSSAALSGPLVDARVVLAWMPPGVEDRVLDRIVAWIESGSKRVGLIGCIAGPSDKDAERVLAAGFDDAIVEPDSVRELAARVRALTRRLDMAAAQPRAGLRFGSLTIDPSRFQLTHDGKRILLTRTELAVMTALAAAQGSAISRAEILDAAWGDQNFEVGERSVDNVILRLRRKLGTPDLIVTVRGVGFRLAET
jgi:DNA-binding response OmpR family regulator